MASSSISQYQIQSKCDEECEQTPQPHNTLILCTSLKECIQLQIIRKTRRCFPYINRSNFSILSLLYRDLQAHCTLSVCLSHLTVFLIKRQIIMKLGMERHGTIALFNFLISLWAPCEFHSWGHCLCSGSLKIYVVLDLRNIANLVTVQF